MKSEKVVREWLRREIGAILFLLLIGFSPYGVAQNPNPACMPSVPYFNVNLSASPSGVWTSSNVARQDQCCGAASSDDCIAFDVTLNPNVAGIQIDMIGADPAGSLFYSINCAGLYPGGTIKCISGAGPHRITFCKPGGNKNIYKITAVSVPLFPKDDTVRIGCKQQMISYGIVNTTVSWQSVFPGTPGQYNSYLDSTNVASPTYSPGANAPAYVDYQVCGFPQASSCGFSVAVCDTVRIYNFPTLTATVSPNPATFCNIGSGSGVTLNANGIGGQAPYTYVWTSGSSTVGTSGSYFASVAGNYNVEVRDFLYNSSSCPSFFQSVAVTQGTLPSVDAGPNQKVCANNPSVTLNGLVQFAPGGIWSGGTGTFSPGNTFLNAAYMPSASELVAGFVKLYLTSTGASGSCLNKTDSVYIYYSPISVTIPPATLSCYSSTTTLSALVNGGTSPFIYTWSNGSNGSVTNAGPGNYSIFVKDSLGCLASANVNLAAPSQMNIVFTVTNVSSNGGSNGTASVTVSGGNPAYTATWSPGGQNTFGISNLSYGVYTVSVMDANGCIMAGSTVVNDPKCSGFFAAASSTNVLCNGGSTGQASVNVIGGAPAYTYTWNSSPPQNTALATNLNAGVYSVLIQDANQCYQTANVIVTEPNVLTDVITYTNVSNIGGNDGAAAVNIFGGTSPYSYLWNFGATSASVNNLTAGTYTVILTDANGCSKIDSIKIVDPLCADLTLNVAMNNVTCNGGNDGTALAVITGANAPYTINWSTAQTGTSISSLVAGNYTVHVTDSKNCTRFLNFTIAQPSPLSIGLLPTDVSCHGDNNGTIDLTPWGGNYAYSFLWSNGATSEDLINLPPGTYSVNLTDSKGCVATASAVIAEPPVMNASFTFTNVTCLYGSNGAISLNVNGGMAPFTYTWSNGASSQTINNIPAGGYSVTVEDANGCVINQPLLIPVMQPDSVQLDSFIVACPVPGSGNTQVTVFPSGGSAGVYQISYDNGNTFQASGNYTMMLANGNTYTVVVKDSNNCTSLASSIITINNEISINSVVFSTCSAPGTASIPVVVNISGGNAGPYAVSLDNGVSFQTAGTYSFSLNTGSSYTLLVKDSKGCISSSTVISLPAPLSGNASVTSNYNGQDISCFGFSDGSADVTVSGGTAPFVYSWNTSPAQNTAIATGLSAGTYIVNVSDVNGCSTNLSVTLSQPTKLNLNLDSVSDYNGFNTTCFGSLDGSIMISVNGGVPVYSYIWSNGAVTEDLSGIGAGFYLLNVVDANGCPSSVGISLDEPAPITSSYLSTQPLCYGDQNGSVDLSVNGGVLPITYNWSNGATTQDNAGLGAGSYSVTITDNNGCSISSAVSVKQPQDILIANRITGILCYKDSTGAIDISCSGGTEPLNYTWSNGASTEDISNVNSGVYTLTVMDVNGCLKTASIEMIQPDSLYTLVSSPSQFSGYNVSYQGGSDGQIDLTVNGGSSPYSFLWSNQSNTEDQFNVQASHYQVEVTDANGCKTVNDISLTEPNILEMPSGFSPNSDGKNDFFLIRGLESYPINALTIFNRWGNVIYEKINYQNDWNGSGITGQSLPDGTYFAVLDVENGKQVLKGYVELRR
jgi:gliding motility-associated-like protein